jgi:hypothetical protein
VPVTVDVQSAITQRYGELTNAITHDPAAEKSVLAPNFTDASKAKLSSFEYDPVTVVVQKMSVEGSAVLVTAQYVGIHGHNVATIDRWVFLNGKWYLAARHQ